MSDFSKLEEIFQKENVPPGGDRGEQKNGKPKRVSDSGVLREQNGQQIKRKKVMKMAPETKSDADTSVMSVFAEKLTADFQEREVKVKQIRKQMKLKADELASNFAVQLIQIDENIAEVEKYLEKSVNRAKDMKKHSSVTINKVVNGYTKDWTDLEDSRKPRNLKQFEEWEEQTKRVSDQFAENFCKEITGKILRSIYSKLDKDGY